MEKYGIKPLVWTMKKGLGYTKYADASEAPDKEKANILDAVAVITHLPYVGYTVTFENERRQRLDVGSKTPSFKSPEEAKDFVWQVHVGSLRKKWLE